LEERLALRQLRRAGQGGLVSKKSENFEATNCRSCGALIIWARTDKGRAMPVDAQMELNGNLALYKEGNVTRVKVVDSGYVGLRHRPHFATCPHADEWRKP
jgi:hypothetical protein